MVRPQSISLEDWAPYRALAGAWTGGVVRLRVSGLWGLARPLVVSALLDPDPRPCLILVSGIADAQRWAGDLRFFGARAVEFPPPEPRLWRGGRHRAAGALRAPRLARIRVGGPVAGAADPAPPTARPAPARAHMAGRPP